MPIGDELSYITIVARLSIGSFHRRETRDIERLEIEGGIGRWGEEKQQNVMFKALETQSTLKMAFAKFSKGHIPRQGADRRDL